MSKRSKDVQKGRRSFLKGVAAAGGAATVAAAAGGAAVVSSGRDEAQAAPAPASRGYRETEHIRQYYDKARF